MNMDGRGYVGMIDELAIAWYYHAHKETVSAWGGGEMVDAGDLKSPGATHEGSIPSRPTSITSHIPV